MKQGLAIYDHDNMTYEQYLEATSKYSKFGGYDEKRHM